MNLRFFTLTLLLLISATGEREVSRTSDHERGTTTMGVEVSVYLFNQRNYREKVLPAYTSLVEKDETDSLIALLKECAEELMMKPHLAEKLFWDQESIDEAIGVLNGTVYYSPDDGRSSNQGSKDETKRVRRSFVRWVLGSNIVEILCVPHKASVSNEQDMTNTPLVPYLYGKSKWIKDLFTFVRPVSGGCLELPLGESTEVFTKKDLQQFSRELDRIAPPEQRDLRIEYDNLRAILKLAMEDPDLTLVISVA